MIYVVYFREKNKLNVIKYHNKKNALFEYISFKKWYNQIIQYKRNINLHTIDPKLFEHIA